VTNQFHGVLLNATIRNLIAGANTIAGNDVGVRVVGDTNTNQVAGRNNQVVSNWIQDNELGVFIDGSPDAIITDNTIQMNLAIGIGLRGGLAARNTIQRNQINRNQGTTFFAPTGQDEPIGTGVYIEAARDNLIGATRGPAANNPNRNTIADNSLAGVYFYNNATGNLVQRNEIDPQGGDYGILFFNSARNLEGARRNDNRITSTARVARYREFTGSPVQILVALPELPGVLPRNGGVSPTALPTGPDRLMR
jgi:parallel beta-helix repeat protein